MKAKGVLWDGRSIIRCMLECWQKVSIHSASQDRISIIVLNFITQGSWRLVEWSCWGKWLMVDGVDSLKTQRIQNWDSDTPVTPKHRHPIHSKTQQSKKCDQEPLLKINCSCLPLSKYYVDKDNAVCRVEASIPTGPLDNVSIEQAKRSTQDQSVFAGLVVYVVANATLRGNMITDWRVKLYCTLRSSWVFY